MPLYLDQDCVLADFNAGLAAHGLSPNWETVHLKRSEMTAAQLAHDDRIAEVMANPGFFEWLGPMPDARELWDYASRVDPGFCILTARPRNDATAGRVIREKRAMIHRVFGPMPDSRFIVCLKAQKKDYVGYRPGPVQVLVDDAIPNCNAWCAAGGYAVLHTSAADSINRVDMLMREAGHAHRALSLV